MLCSSCGRGLPDGGLTCGACGASVTRSGSTGVPAPSLSSDGSTTSRRRQAARLVATVALLATAGFAMAAFRPGDDGETLVLDEPGAGEGGYTSEGDSYGVTGDDTYDPGPSASPSGSYGTTVPPSTGTYVELSNGSHWADGVEATFNAYFEGINSGDPQRAWMQLSPRRQEQTSLDEFADAVRTSYDDDVVVQDAGYTAGRAHVWLEFTSTQDPALGPVPGEGCTRWSLDYVLLEQADGTFVIDEVAGHGGTPGHSPCQ